MTSDELAGYRRIAEAATPGPWTLSLPNGFGDHRVTTTDDFFGLMGVPANDADHIATFDPPTVLRLLDLIEQLQRDRENLLRLAGAGAVAEMQQTWRPIETAPRDGTKVLLWGTDEDGERRLCEVGRHLPGDNMWRTSTGLPMWPTHWMPLPQPPEQD